MQQGVSILEFIKSINMNTAIDDGLCHLYEVQPPTARDTLNEFIASLRKYEPAYFQGVQEQFEATLHFVVAHGFVDPHAYQQEHPEENVTNVSLSCLHFAIPLANGSAFELFPGGAYVSVTQSTLGHFRGLLAMVRKACLALYQHVVGGNSARPLVNLSTVEGIGRLSPVEIMQEHPLTKLAEYLTVPEAQNVFFVPLTHVYLPFAAEIHLVTDSMPRANKNRNYGAVLEMMQTVVCDTQSPWFIGKSDSLTPADPRAAASNATPKFSSPEELWSIFGVNNVVPFNGRFFLVEWERQARSRSSSGTQGSEVEAARLVSLADVPMYVSSALATVACLRAQQEAGLPLTGKWMSLTPTGGSSSTNTSQQEARVEPSPPLVDTLGFEIGPSERQFWEELDALKRDPEKNFPANKMSFVISLPGGRVVLKANGEFIDVTRHNLGLFIDAVLEHKEQIHRTFASSEASPNGSVMVATPPSRHRGQLPPQHRRGQHSRAAREPATAVEAAPSSPSSSQRSAVPGVASLDEYPVAMSHKWNSFTISPEDIIGRAYVDQIASLENQFDSGQVSDERLNREKFYIPTLRGPYELIPNGKQISVTRAGAKEYFYRIRGELAKVDTSRTAWEPPEPAAASSSPPAKPPTAPRPSSSLRHKAVLDDRDLLFLREFAGHVEQLSSHESLDVALREAQLHFSIYFPDRQITIELKPNGMNIPVTAVNFPEYLSLFQRTHDEIEKELLAKREYVIPASRRVNLANYPTTCATNANSRAVEARDLGAQQTPTPPSHTSSKRAGTGFPSP